MKKALLVMSGLLALSVALPAPGDAQIGIRGGINLTDFFGDRVDNTDPVQSMSYGLTAGLIRIGPVQIVAEGYYRKKGAGWRVLDAIGAGGGLGGLDSAQVAGLAGAGSGGESLEFGLDYVEVPLLLRFNLPTYGRRFRPYFNAGPAFGWQIDCGVTVSVAAGAGSEPEAACEDLSGENVKETLREYETGLVVGAGLDVSVLGGAGALTLDLRMTRGLSRLSEGQNGPDVRNQAISAMLGYTFGFF
ncbi:MAG: outer membrane beta-barrel protein [Longimicrobiales bacterium]